MKLIEITSQYRRDFTGTYECEYCGNIRTDIKGYDDSFFHHKVTPGMPCVKCGKSTLSEGGEVHHVETKYPEGYQI